MPEIVFDDARVLHGYDYVFTMRITSSGETIVTSGRVSRYYTGDQYYGCNFYDIHRNAHLVRFITKLQKATTNLFDLSKHNIWKMHINNDREFEFRGDGIVKFDTEEQTIAYALQPIVHQSYTNSAPIAHPIAHQSYTNSTPIAHQ